MNNPNTSMENGNDGNENSGSDDGGSGDGGMDGPENGHPVEKNDNPSGSRPGSSDEETISLTLKKTADLHGISPSYLSRRVRQGKPAKGHDLSGYAVIEDGRIKGFEFPLGHDFPGASGNAVPGGDDVSVGDAAADKGSFDGDALDGGPSDGESPDRRPSSEDDQPGKADGPREKALTEEPADQQSSADGFARTARQFHSGLGAWGRLQLVTEAPDGGEKQVAHLDFFPVEDPATVEDVAETYGAGTYRLSRLASGQEVSFTFEVSRMAPSEVEQRLARTDELKYRHDLLREELAQAEERVAALEERVYETEEELREVEEELRAERFQREQVEKDLEWMEGDFDQILSRKKERLEREKDREVRDAKRELKRKIRNLESELESKDWEHKQEIRDLKYQHELEKIQLKKGQEQKYIRQFGRLAEEIADGIANNPGVARELVYRALKATGLEDLAEKFAAGQQNGQSQEGARSQENTHGENARGQGAGSQEKTDQKQKTGGQQAGDSQRQDSDGREQDSEETERAGAPVEINVEHWKQITVASFFESFSAENPPPEVNFEKEALHRAPLRPERGLYQLICPLSQ